MKWRYLLPIYLHPFFSYPISDDRRKGGLSGRGRTLVDNIPVNK